MLAYFNDDPLESSDCSSIRRRENIHFIHIQRIKGLKIKWFSVLEFSLNERLKLYGKQLIMYPTLKRILNIPHGIIQAHIPHGILIIPHRMINILCGIYFSNILCGIINIPCGIWACNIPCGIIFFYSALSLEGTGI